MGIIDIHSRLGNTALFYTIAMVIWSFWRFFRKQPPDSNFWGALAIAEILYLIQGALGMLIWLTGKSVVDNLFMHGLYGVVGLLVVPGMFIYSRGRESVRLMVIFGAALLFQIGIIIRGMMTG